MRTVGQVVVASLALLTLACGELPSGNDDLSLSPQFHDGAWVLTVDRALRAGVMPSMPDDALSESDFEPFEGDRSYRLTVSENGERISVPALSLEALLEKATPGERRYSMVSGTFAGGRLVVWRATRGLQAELTIYGSGVPVTQSERGPLDEEP